MAYRIIYEGERNDIKTGRIVRCFCLSSIFFFCFVWAVFSCWPEGAELLRSILIPGDPEQTLLAAEVLAQEIKGEHPIFEAVEHFIVAIQGREYSA